MALTKKPRRELLMRLLTDQRRELRRHRCFNVRSDARLTPSSNGADVAMTDIEENVPSAGQVGSELPPNLQMQPIFPLWEAR